MARVREEKSFHSIQQGADIQLNLCQHWYHTNIHVVFHKGNNKAHENERGRLRSSFILVSYLLLQPETLKRSKFGWDELTYSGIILFSPQAVSPPPHLLHPSRNVCLGSSSRRIRGPCSNSLLFSGISRWRVKKSNIIVTHTYIYYLIYIYGSTLNTYSTVAHRTSFYVSYPPSPFHVWTWRSALTCMLLL